MNWMEQKYFNNTVSDYLWFVGIIVLGFVLQALFSKLLSRQLYRVVKHFAQNLHPQEFVNLLKKPVGRLMVLITLMLAFDRIMDPFGLRFKTGKSYIYFDDVLEQTFKVLLVLSITWILLRLSDFIAFVMKQQAEGENRPNDWPLIKFFKEIIKVIICIVGLLFILGTIFHVNVTSLVAGLGIGGLAIALAAQETIANLLGSFVIFLDKPFNAGDIIENTEVKGVVESVGFRSTKLRTFDKTLVTVPNKKLVDSALTNISRTNLRRVRFQFSLNKGTDMEQIKNVIKDIEELIDAEHLTAETKAVNFTDINEQGFVITVVYFVETQDLDVVVQIKEKINFKILEVLERNKTSFAIPTTQLYLQSDSGTSIQ